ncbi:LysR family transcriptional regulator [Bacillus megaterium]|nr:LysR family transcriptional regulator [Priestia megaterium]
MTLQQFRYIVEIAKHNSMSKAASALYVTQPSISKAVRDLERELGIIILDRTNKGVVFTKDGTELLFYAKMF